MSEPIMGTVVISDPIPGGVEPAAMETVADVRPAAPLPRLRRIEEWARIHKTSAVMLKAAARGARWECGDQVDPCIVSEAEYLAAVAFAENPYAFANPPKKTEP